MKTGYSKTACLLTVVFMLVLCACSSSRHVPKGSYLLDKVSIKVDSNARDYHFDMQELSNYLRQQPNHKMLWSMRFRLGIYNMSGKDSTKWWNKWVRKLGEPPVIYDSALTAAGKEQLRKVLINKGFLEAEVDTDTTINEKKRKIRVDYKLRPGKEHRIRNIDYEFEDEAIREIVMHDSLHFPVKEGIPLDRNILESQRELITTRLRNHGYYEFAKEFITFNADTTEGSYDVDLTMKVAPSGRPGNQFSSEGLNKFLVRNIYVVTDFNPAAETSDFSRQVSDTVVYKDITILYGKDKYLNPKTLYENCFLRTGTEFRQRDVDRTYQAFSRLNILNFISVKFQQIASVGDTGLLDAYILLTPGRSQNISLELEGTNSEGDLGVAVGLNYSHRNIGKGSETLSTRVRAAYEALSGNLDGLLHNRYLELSADVGISFPKFKAPLLRESFKRKINASTQFDFSLNYQERPEYTRIIATAGWSYRWSERRTGNRHTFTPVDINYVHLPESTNDFIDKIAPDNPLLRYSYEDHFIMRLGYSFYHTNKRPASAYSKAIQRNISTIRVNVETAGNFLFAMSSIFNHRGNFHNDPYKVFGIHYSQYIKGEADYGFLHTFDHRNSLALHAGFGIGIPYANSSILPFEKRFYDGGANGVRGWAVRTLGPGKYRGSNSVSDFIHQCGDIRLDLSAEFRSKLFWVLELGLFVDAGNIWTIRDYPTQPGGVFKFNSFYKQIALAYGAGLRLDFSYFLLRFDMGMKAHNPAEGEQPWPIIHPNWRRDHSFHFSIGYPF